MEQQHTNKTRSLLNAMYKNVEMGAEAILNILPKAEDKKFRAELTKQTEAFEGYANKISDLLRKEGEQPAEPGFMAKMGSKMGTMMNTMLDSTTSHLAEMMIEGATMGITDMTRQVREYENTDCSEKALSLAREIIGFEEDTVERMKAYL